MLLSVFLKGGNMFHKFSIKQAILTVGIALVAQSAFASTVMTACPSTEMLKKFDGDYTESHPTAFDQQNGRMTVSILQRRKFSDDDMTFGGYGKLVFILSGVTDYPGVENEETAQSALDQLQLDSEVPYMYRPFKDVVIPVCSYSVPGEAVKAVVYQVPEFKTPKATVKK